MERVGNRLMDPVTLEKYYPGQADDLSQEVYDR